MRTIFGAALLVGLAVCAPAMGQMQEAAPTCPAPVAPVGPLAPWISPVGMQAVGDQQRVSRARLVNGQAARLSLLQTPDVHYPLRPEKPGGSVSFGGLAQIVVRESGTYRVALSSAAWIDVVTGKGGLKPVTFGRGPDCTGIRKMVDFVLTPGRYTLQIAANGTPEVTVLVARLP